MKIDRLISIGFALVLAFLLTLAAAGAANAGTRDHEPATRAYVVKQLVERALLEDVTYPERREYWLGTECFADNYLVSKIQRKRTCFVASLGFMRGYDTGAYPEFGHHDHVRRDQMASIVWRLATYGEELAPDGNGVFIDVSRRNVHEDAIRWGAYTGIIKGYDTTPATFRPAAPVTRRQVRTLVDRVTVYWATGGQR